MTVRLLGWAFAAVVVAFGAGWFVGSSGRAEALLARDAAVADLEATRARSLVLDGRVSLFLTNFGDASQRFEEARALIEAQQTAARETGRAARAGRLEIVLSGLRDAQRLAAAFDPSAQNAAAQALRALDAAD